MKDRDGLDAVVLAEQNARLVRNAEMYYRAMFGGQVESWNLRDTHMMETLDALMAWTTRRSGYARAVVWAHNAHLGDARATQMGAWGELNLGQLARERHRERVFLRASHYFRARIADQFDAVIHIDTTSALTPLERWSRENADLPETYPTGV